MLQRGVSKNSDPLLWQWKALLERSIDEHEAALASFAEAARLAPADVSVAHGHARNGDGSRAGRAAAVRAGEGGSLRATARSCWAWRPRAPRWAKGARAIDELQAALRAAPAWLYGHEQLAQLKATQGQAADATASLEEALGRFPTAQPLWETLLNVQLRRGAYETLAEIVERAGAAGVSSPEFAIYRGILRRGIRYGALSCGPVRPGVGSGE